MRVTGALLVLAAAAVAAQEQSAALRGAEDEEALMGADGRELKAAVVYPKPSEPESVSGAYTPEEEGDGTVAQGAGNHPVCYKVAATWWSTRVSNAPVRVAQFVRHSLTPACDWLPHLDPVVVVLSSRKRLGRSSPRWTPIARPGTNSPACATARQRAPGFRATRRRR